VIFGGHATVLNPANKPEYSLERERMEHFTREAENALSEEDLHWELRGEYWYTESTEAFDFSVSIAYGSDGTPDLDSTAELIIEEASSWDEHFRWYVEIAQSTCEDIASDIEDFLPDEDLE
jgi:hypothetical protein